MIKKTILACLMAGFAAFGIQAESILDIKHSITNDNIVPPESFETKTRELEENFYLKNYVDRNFDEKDVRLGTAAEYEDLLSRLPVAIEMPYNSIVGNFINMYLGRKRRLLSDMIALHRYYGPIFKDAIEREGLPTELQYLPVIESAINPNAVSRAGAAGLWQFMPSTATGLGLEVNSLVDQRRDPALSSRQAARYFKQLYNIYDDWSLAIAAYNCGPGRVNQALRRAGGGKKDFWEIYEYLPQETRDYVPAFIAANFVMNYYDRYGIRPTLVKRPLVTDQVEVNDRVHFQQIADILNIPIEEIRMLNPQFRRDIIPGNHHPYKLTLPKQQCLSYIMSEDKIKAYEADNYATRTHVEPGESRFPQTTDDATAQTDEEAPAMVEGKVVRKTHIVGRGENLREIAKKYGVSATDIKHWNKLRRGKVKEGQELVIEVVERPDRSLAQASAPKRRAAAEESRASKRNSETESASSSRSRKERAASRGDDDRSRSAAASSSKSRRQAKRTKQTPRTIRHTVKSGESLDRIARRYGVTVSQLRTANGMSKSSTMIQPGQKLKVPSKGSGAAYSKKKSSTHSKSTKAGNSSKKKKSTRKRSRR